MCLCDQLVRSLDKAYAIGHASKEDIHKLLKGLGLVRSLLLVQVGPDEEEILKTSIWSVHILAFAVVNNGIEVRFFTYMYMYCILMFIKDISVCLV